MAWYKSGTKALGLGYSGLWDPGPRTRDLPQSLKVGPRTPLKFKSGTPGPSSKFKSGTLLIFLHCLTYYVLDKYIYNMELNFHEKSVF